VDRQDDVKKLKEAVKTYATANVTVHEIDALDGKNPETRLPTPWPGWKLDKEAIEELTFADAAARATATDMWTKDLNRGEVACAATHALVWEKGHASNYDYVIVFEDDCAYTGDDYVKALITTVFEKNINFHILRLANTKCDCVGSTWERDTAPGSILIDMGRDCRPLVESSTSWTGAYVLSKQGCQRLDASKFKQDDNIINVDDFLFALSGAHPRHDLSFVPAVRNTVWGANEKWINLRTRQQRPGQETNVVAWGVFQFTDAADEGDCFGNSWYPELNYICHPSNHHNKHASIIICVCLCFVCVRVC
jgi:GR25 family glycosyltransferase involved in LPS biosynthesis